MAAVLVLDVDGVVVRGHPEGGRWDRDLARDLGIRPELLQRHFFAPYWQRIVTGELDMMPVLEQVWPALDSSASPRLLVDYWFAADSAIDPDVLAAVDRWRGKGGRAFLATVQEHGRARHLMDALGLGRHFEAILYSAALGAAKPHPLFYQRAEANLPATGSDVIFLDDIAANVDAAAAFGWRAHHFRSAADVLAAIRQF